LASAWPLLAVLALGVKLTSPGPALFKQSRSGRDGHDIGVLKFRTMRVTENGSDVRQASKNDPRVTRFGAFLRRTSLDELPQFVNVLLGDMSVVGPRPHAVAHNAHYRTKILEYMLRHKVRPGITGWAQVNGFRGETDTVDKMVERVAHDLEYIRRWSLLFDVRIVFLTVFGRGVRKNAY
jgi:putative colanic acid biosynthesis UDP-glucose lipid carrier transferase